MRGELKPETMAFSEKKPGHAALSRHIGVAALAMTGVWAGKKLIGASTPARQRLLEKLAIDEHDSLEKNVGIFKSLAESYGVRVQDKHLHYWSTMYDVARALDTIVDESGSTTFEKDVTDLLSGSPIPGVTEPVAQSFQSIVATSTDERRDIIMAGLEIKTIAHQLRTASEPEEMLELRRKEGEIFARIMTLDNPDDDRSIAAYNDGLVQLSVASYHFDSLIDLRADFHDGTSGVPPTLTNYFAVGKRASQEGISSLSCLPRRAVLGLGVAAVRKASRKALQP